MSKTSGQKKTPDINPAIRNCRACLAEYSEGAKVCQVCGSPTSRISGYTYIHRNTIAAVGILATVLALSAVIVNLYATRSQLNIQRKFFVEQFRPRLETTFKRVRFESDTLWVDVDLENKGHSDAFEIGEQAHVLTLTGDSLGEIVRNRDMLTAGTRVSMPYHIPNHLVPYQSPFFLCIVGEFRWVGEEYSSCYEGNYGFTWDAERGRYRVREVSKEDLNQAGVNVVF